MDQVRTEAVVIAAGGSLGEALRVAKDWPRSGEQVALEIVANYAAIQKNNRVGKPLKLAGKTYSRGLFCHAPSKIVVRLPGPREANDAVFLSAAEAAMALMRLTVPILFPLMTRSWLEIAMAGPPMEFLP